MPVVVPLPFMQAYVLIYWISIALLHVAFHKPISIFVERDNALFNAVWGWLLPTVLGGMECGLLGHVGLQADLDWFDFGFAWNNACIFWCYALIFDFDWLRFIWYESFAQMLGLTTVAWSCSLLVLHCFCMCYVHYALCLYAALCLRLLSSYWIVSGMLVTYIDVYMILPVSDIICGTMYAHPH